MEHRAELLVHAYLSDVRKGKAGMSDDTIKGIVKHVEAAVRRQFQTKNTRNFKLRASNIGRSLCQLWFQKNKPEAATPPASHFLMRMMIGDITEAVFKGLLKEAGAKFEEPEKVETEIGGEVISGEYDLILDNKVDDIKSASPWSYRNKWLAYASDPKEVTTKLANTVTKLKDNAFARCFKPIKEMFRGVHTGNYILDTECKFCDFKKACWGESLSEEPSRVSRAKDKPVVFYIDK